MGQVILDRHTAEKFLCNYVSLEGFFDLYKEQMALGQRIAGLGWSFLDRISSSVDLCGISSSIHQLSLYHQYNQEKSYVLRAVRVLTRNDVDMETKNNVDKIFQVLFKRHPDFKESSLQSDFWNRNSFKNKFEELPVEVLGLVGSFLPIADRSRLYVDQKWTTLWTQAENYYWSYSKHQCGTHPKYQQFLEAQSVKELCEKFNHLKPPSSSPISFVSSPDVEQMIGVVCKENEKRFERDLSRSNCWIFDSKYVDAHKVKIPPVIFGVKEPKIVYFTEMSLGIYTDHISIPKGCLVGFSNSKILAPFFIEGCQLDGSKNDPKTAPDLFAVYFDNCEIEVFPSFQENLFQDEQNALEVGYEKVRYVHCINCRITDLSLVPFAQRGTGIRYVFDNCKLPSMTLVQGAEELDPGIKIFPEDFMKDSGRKSPQVIVRNCSAN